MSARFDARVNPNGAPAAYYFEYGSDGSCDSHPCLATEERPVGDGNLTRLVSVEVGGLQAATTYHYRVVVQGGVRAVVGADMTLKTRPTGFAHGPAPLPGPPGSDRAWELVTAPDIGGNPVSGGTVASDGERAIYTVEGGTPSSAYGSLESPHYSERTASGWHEVFLSPDRSEADVPIWTNRDGPSDLSFFDQVDPNAEESSFWRFRFGAAPIRLLELTPFQVFHGWLATAYDGSRALALLSGQNLDSAHPEAASEPNIYEIDAGSPRLVSLLPDGSVSPCGVGGSFGAFAISRPGLHPLSTDGRFLFFPSRGAECGGESQLYVAALNAGTTKLVSGPSLSGPSCGAAFLRSTPEAAFFWTRSRLVAEDSEPATCEPTSPPVDGDVYRYDVVGDSLECVTCVVSGQAADVYAEQENAEGAARDIAVSEDGSTLYFQSPRSLVPGAPTVSGGGSTYRLDVAEGDLAWVAGPGVAVGSQNPMSADGSVVYFLSDSAWLNPLGGLDNGGSRQYYRYGDVDRSLVCVSCPQDGRAPMALAEPRLLPRMVDEGGNFVFDTPTPLATADLNTAEPGEPDTNGNDVYEWRDGEDLLVSDGATSWPVEVGWPRAVGISESGRDVFFLEAARLTWEADDAFERLWDARIGGGFPQPFTAPPCAPEACFLPQPPPEPEAAPPTLSFLGPGNRKRHHRPRRHRRRSLLWVGGRVVVAKPLAWKRGGG